MVGKASGLGPRKWTKSSQLVGAKHLPLWCQRRKHGHRYAILLCIYILLWAVANSKRRSSCGLVCVCVWGGGGSKKEKKSADKSEWFGFTRVVQKAGAGPIVFFSNPAGYCLNRTKLTVRRSVDGGLNYKQSLQIMAGAGGYSCLVLLPDATALRAGADGGGVGIAFERGISGDPSCSGGGCAISFEPLPADFVANGTSASVGIDASNPGNDCGPG